MSSVDKGRIPCGLGEGVADKDGVDVCVGVGVCVGVRDGVAVSVEVRVDAADAESAALRERTPVPEAAAESLTDGDALVAGVALLLPLVEEHSEDVPVEDTDTEALALHAPLGDAAAEPLELNDSVALGHADAQADRAEEVEAVSSLEGDDNDETVEESEGVRLAVNVTVAQPERVSVAETDGLADCVAASDCDEHSVGVGVEHTELEGVAQNVGDTVVHIEPESDRTEETLPNTLADADAALLPLAQWDGVGEPQTDTDEEALMRGDSEESTLAEGVTDARLETLPLEDADAPADAEGDRDTRGLKEPPALAQADDDGRPDKDGATVSDTLWEVEALSDGEPERVVDDDEQREGDRVPRVDRVAGRGVPVRNEDEDARTEEDAPPLGLNVTVLHALADTDADALTVVEGVNVCVPLTLPVTENVPVSDAQEVAVTHEVGVSEGEPEAENAAEAEGSRDGESVDDTERLVAVDADTDAQDDFDAARDTLGAVLKDGEAEPDVDAHPLEDWVQERLDVEQMEGKPLVLGVADAAMLALVDAD